MYVQGKTKCTQGSVLFVVLGIYWGSWNVIPVDRGWVLYWPAERALDKEITFLHKIVLKVKWDEAGPRSLIYHVVLTATTRLTGPFCDNVHARALRTWAPVWCRLREGGVRGLEGNIKKIQIKKTLWKLKRLHTYKLILEQVYSFSSFCQKARNTFAAWLSSCTEDHLNQWHYIHFKRLHSEEGGSAGAWGFIDFNTPLSVVAGLRTEKEVTL